MMERIERRNQEIMTAVRQALQVARPLRMYLRLEPEVERLGYVAKPFDMPADVVPVDDPQAPADLALFTQHGLDVGPAIWKWRLSHPGGLVLLWLWDNHLGQLHNLHSALAADIVFPSHAYVCSYLRNPLSILGPHLPACCAQWQGVWQEPARRSDRLMAHYVDYPWAARTSLLAQLAEESDWANVRRLPPEDKRGYFAQTPDQRLQEWLGHKVSLVLPVDRDLSTRFFDALYAGQVPLLAGDFPDLSSVVCESEQERLGIVHVPEMTLASIREGYARALARFDEDGEGGIMERSSFVAREHSFGRRLSKALDTALNLVMGRHEIDFAVAPASSGFKLNW